MPTYESSNLIEIEFATFKAMNDFKKLTGTKVGKNEFLDITKIFPLDPIPVVDRQDFYDELLNCRQEPQSGDNIYTSGMWEVGLTLSYRFYTTVPPIFFVRSLYIYFHVKRVTLTYRDLDDIVFINKKQKTICRECRYSSKKKHKSCVPHRPSMKLDLNWSGRPHPVFEPKKMINELKWALKNTDDKSIAFIYHCIIGKLTFFDKINFGPIRDARDEFDKRVEKTKNIHLKLMTAAGDYGFPQGGITKNQLCDFLHMQFLCKAYQQEGISSQLNDPVLDKLKKKK